MGSQLQRTGHVSTQQLWEALQRERDGLVKEKIESDLCEQVCAELKGRLPGQPADVDSAVIEALQSLLRNQRLYDAKRGTVSAYVLGAARRILRRVARQRRTVSLYEIDVDADSMTNDSVECEPPQIEGVVEQARERALQALTANEREIYELARAGFAATQIQARLQRHGRRKRPTIASIRSMKSRATRKVEAVLRSIAQMGSHDWP